MDLGALDYGSPAFVAAYEAAKAGADMAKARGAGGTVPGSLGDLIASFYRSATWTGLSASTRKSYRGVIEAVRVTHGHLPVNQMRRRHVMALMAAKADTPAAANNRLKRLRQLLDHALDLEWIETNPARTVRLYSVPEGGFHTWSEAEIARFMEAHPRGSVARLAFSLMLYTGASRADAVALGRANLTDDGHITYRRRKTRKRTPVVVHVPVHPDLAAELAEVTHDGFTFLQTRYGAARTPDGLARRMREWCDSAGLPQCTSHGLRKAITRRLAEAGATGPQIIAVTGHRTIAEAQPYLDAADRKVNAAEGMAKLGTSSGSNVANHPARFATKRRKALKGDGK